MSKIKIHCEGCMRDLEVDRTYEIPEEVTSLVCNWCPFCENTARDNYREQYRYLKIDEVADPNQQSLF